MIHPFSARKTASVTARATRAVVQELERRVLLSGALLDSSFGAGGIVQPNEGNEILATLGLPGGKVLLVGKNYMERFNANGSRDATFGDAGLVRIPLPFQPQLFAAAPGGKLVVLGSLGLHHGFIRFKVNGSLDNTFGNGGVVDETFGASINAMLVQPDGKIIVGGIAGFQNIGTGTDMLVARYGSDGSIDRAFGINGQTRVDFNGWFRSNYNDTLFALALRPDGRIIGAGSADGTTGMNFGLIQLTSRGQLDPTFGNGQGKVQTANTTDHISQIALEPDGSIVAAGYDVLVHYSASGTFDTSFGDNGFAAVAYNGFDAPNFALQPDGKILAFSGTEKYLEGGNNPVKLIRYTTQGQIDPSFGGGGSVVVTQRGPALNLSLFLGSGTGLVPQANRIIIAGTLTTEVNGSPRRTGFGRGAEPYTAEIPILLGYRLDGTRDPSFGSAGQVTQSPSGIIGAFDSVAALPNGDALAAGWTLDANYQTAMYVARYLPEGSLDPSFGLAGRIVSHAGGFDFASQLTVEPNGGFLVMATSGDPGGAAANSRAIVRFTASGALDGTFASAGVLQIQDLTEYLLQPDGKIIANTIHSAYPSPTDELRRYDVNGKSLDRAFGSGGVVNSFNGFPIGGLKLTLQGSDVFIATSTYVAKLLPNGAINPNFPIGGGGGFSFDTMSFKVAADGSVAIMGKSLTYGDLEISGVDCDRALSTTSDIAAGLDGQGQVDAAWTRDDLIAQRDGRFFVAFMNGDLYGGSPALAAVLTRCNPDGSPDPNFFPAQIPLLNPMGLAQTSSGNIVMVGMRLGQPVIVRYIQTPAAKAAAALASTPRGFAGEILTVVGTNGGDAITISQSAAKITVTINGNRLGVFDAAPLEQNSVYGSSIRVFGLAGNDTIAVSTTTIPVAIDGGDGNDSIVMLGSPRAILAGGAGDDSVIAGDGKALLLGGTGNDLLTGGAGADTFHGGDGNDVLRLGTGLTNDVYGDGGLDTVDYSKRTQGLTIKLDGVRDSGRSGEHDLIGIDVERVWGSQGNDIIFGNTGAAGTAGTKDALYGLGGNDTLYAGNGSDALYGGDGNDWLYSRNGVPDYLDGGPGFDSAHIDKMDKYVDIEMLLP